MERPEPVIDRVEYDLKDELVRQTIMDTQEDVEMLLEKFEKMEERIDEARCEKCEIVWCGSGRLSPCPTTRTSASTYGAVSVPILILAQDPAKA